WAHCHYDAATAFSLPSSWRLSPSLHYTSRSLWGSTSSRNTQAKSLLHPSSISPPQTRNNARQKISSSQLQLENDDSDDESNSSSNSNIININGHDDNDKMKALGIQLIMQAALQCGATEPMIDVEWKADRIIVTVDVHKDENYEEEDDDWDDEMDDWDEENVEEDIIYDEEIIDDSEEGFDDEFDDGNDLEEEEFDEEGLEPIMSGSEETNSNSNSSGKVDLTLIARTINELLSQDGEESLAFTIAKLHEIEVTTPEFDGVLRGRELTMINVKGRVVKIKNDKIEVVRLPKAKREKGVK
ncbi:hypothetical protein ACHAXR_003915, partial [Thalassiosira sp. AJA248-18]